MRVGGVVSGVAAAMIASSGVIGSGAAIAQPRVLGVKDGVDAWQHNDYTAAVGIWRPLADKGDADAAFDLAQAYKLGRGVPLDLAQAKTLYGIAARGGHQQATANYGLLLFQDGDRAAAMPWIRKASEDGDPRAQYVYGTALFNGDLAAKDWPRAYALMMRAAAAGLPQATTSLSQMDQYVSAADRQKGIALASTMAAHPLPPIDRQMTVASGSALPPQLPPAPLPIRQAQSAAAPAPARHVQIASAIPLPATPPSAPPTTKAARAPKPAAAPVAPAAPAVTNGRWQVQLGAFGSDSVAAASWKQLSARAAGLRGLSPHYEHYGAFVRLRAAGLADKAAATRACASAKAAGAACFPIGP